MIASVSIRTKSECRRVNSISLWYNWERSGVAAISDVRVLEDFLLLEVSMSNSIGSVLALSVTTNWIMIVVGGPFREKGEHCEYAF